MQSLINVDEAKAVGKDRSIRLIVSAYPWEKGVTVCI